jgi:hypothetical protein
MDDTYNFDPEWNKHNQYDPQNQPRPSGWEEALKDFEHTYFIPHFLANLLCGLHYRRECFAPPPLPWPEDIRGLEDLQRTHFWDLDDLERHRWGVYNKIIKAFAYGELNVRYWGVPEDMHEEYQHVEDRWSEDPANQGMRIFDIVPWALESNIPVPEEILKLAGVPDPTPKKTNEGKARALREKRDATFAAALILIQENGIEAYQHQDSGELNLSKLGKDIVAQQKMLFEDGTAPLSSTVFSRQYRAMEARYRKEKPKPLN